MKKRQIESFELSEGYYLESYLNGNKNHVKSELAELFICNPLLAMKELNNLPKDIASAIIESDHFKNAILNQNKKSHEN